MRLPMMSLLIYYLNQSTGTFQADALEDSAMDYSHIFEGKCALIFVIDVLEEYKVQYRIKDEKFGRFIVDVLVPSLNLTSVKRNS